MMQTYTGEPAPLKLPEALNIRAIMEVKELLSDCLSKNSAVALDIAPDAQVDLSFVQLIEAARTYAASCHKTLMLKVPASGALLDVLKRGGFADDISPDTAKFWLHRETI